MTYKPVFHDEHIWTRDRHYPLDPDDAVFILARNGSVVAMHELLSLFLNDVRKERIVPPALCAYIADWLQTLSAKRHKNYQMWREQQSTRKSRAGRPSRKASGLQEAELLNALHVSMSVTRVVDRNAHAKALAILEEEISVLYQRIKRRKATEKSLPRSKRGSPTKAGEAFGIAWDVRTLLKHSPELTTLAAIKSVAETRYWEERGGRRDTSTDSAAIIDQRNTAIARIEKTVERHYYAYKSDFDSLCGLPPLERLMSN